MPSHNATVQRLNLGKLWGISEIAEYADVSRARAGVLVNSPWFPPYFEHMSMGTCWEASAAKAALEEHGYPKPNPHRPLKGVPRRREPKRPLVP